MSPGVVALVRCCIGHVVRHTVLLGIDNASMPAGRVSQITFHHPFFQGSAQSELLLWLLVGFIPSPSKTLGESTKPGLTLDANSQFSLS